MSSDHEHSPTRHEHTLRPNPLGVVLGRRETYTADNLDRLTRFDLAMIVEDLGTGDDLFDRPAVWRPPSWSPNMQPPKHQRRRNVKAKFTRAYLRSLVHVLLEHEAANQQHQLSIATTGHES